MTRFSIRLARKIFKDHFEEDEDFRRVYQSNIAMLLHDRHGITNHKIRNKIADDIMEVIFEAKEFRKGGNIGDIKNRIDNRFEILDL